jgi:putative ABC transport system substrate-binding protein
VFGMRRREFVSLFGGAAAAWPLAARAQQAIPIIGVLSGRTNRYPPFQKGVAETGYEHGRNVYLEFHSVDGRYDQLPTTARELVSRQVTVIAAMGIEAAQAAKEATKSIPIVFVFGVDPLAFGFVPNLNRPGGNITGMSLYTVELQEKRIDLLHELIVNGAPIGMIVNPNQTDTSAQVKIAETAAHAKGHLLVVLKASTANEIDSVFASLSENRVAGILVGGDNFLYSRRDQMIELAARYSVPMMLSFRDDAAAGGLVSYGTNLDEVYRQAGVYAGRILKGDKPGELPIQQPTRFDLVINLKTAKALGLDVPPNLLARADEVIE